MREIDYVRDNTFLKRLDRENIKVYYSKIVVLNDKELPIKNIEGRVTSGSISVNGDSAVRRSGSITFIANEYENDLTDIDTIFTINKRIKLYVGIENNIDENYDKIIWFNQGVYLITQPSISHSINTVTINLQLKDKMCLLNGELGGTLPTSVTFDNYDQQISLIEVDALPENPLTTYVYYNTTDSLYYTWDATLGWDSVAVKPKNVDTTVQVKQKIFDIIQTAVCNFGGEAIEKIIINDIPQELKQIVRYGGKGELYYNEATGVYSKNSDDMLVDPNNWRTFKYNEDCGYVYTDFTYPGELTTGIGDNVCSVLSKICENLGNYEYFYDINGNFIFQEKKNYLNTFYDPIQYKDESGNWHQLSDRDNLLDIDNYYVDFAHGGESIYSFEEGNNLISAYSNVPNYLNIKNDYHIWGKQDKLALHYHVVIKDKPHNFNEYIVEYEKDPLTKEYTGKVKLIDEMDTSEKYEFWQEILRINDMTLAEFQAGEILSINDTETNEARFNNLTETLELKSTPIEVNYYVPTDWRAELYMRGLSKKRIQIRPDMYEQELLDFWDSIYNMKNKEFKVDIVNNPNDLLYWLDYIEPYKELADISVDSIGTKIHTEQQDKVNKMYNADIPDRIFINLDSTPTQRASILSKCMKIGQNFSNVGSSIYNDLEIGTKGYSAQEFARDAIYQHTDYGGSITITSMPIYYIEPNTRITVNDLVSNISGDYVIKSFNLPLDGKGTVTIQATKAFIRL